MIPPGLPPELTAEIFAHNLITRNSHPQRLQRIVFRLEWLLAAADVLREKAIAVQAGEQ